MLMLLMMMMMMRRKAGLFLDTLLRPRDDPYAAPIPLSDYAGDTS